MVKINKEKQVVMPQKILHELFEYDGETGEFTRIKNPAGGEILHEGKLLVV